MAWTLSSKQLLTFEAKEAVEVIKASDVIMSDQVIKATDVGEAGEDPNARDITQCVK